MQIECGSQKPKIFYNCFLPDLPLTWNLLFIAPSPLCPGCPHIPSTDLPWTFFHLAFAELAWSLLEFHYLLSSRGQTLQVRKGK